MWWKALEKSGLEPTAESIKRSGSDRLGDLVP